MSAVVGPVCVVEKPFSENAFVVIDAGENEATDRASSRSIKFGYRKFMCNTGIASIRMKSLNGGLIRKGEKAGETVQNLSGKRHYKVRGRLGSLELSVLDTSRGQNIEYDLPGAYSGPLEFTFEFMNQESAPSAEFYHDVLRIEIGAVL